MTTENSKPQPQDLENTHPHAVVSRAEWLVARKDLLRKEKEFSRMGDELAQCRRDLPWVRITENYAFQTVTGTRTLADLFDGRQQLIIQHFMLAPGWEQGCSGCSFMADHSDGMNVHLANRDVSLVAVSRAPIGEIERFRQRMGWRFRWVSSGQNSFNYDFAVSFTPEQTQAGAVTYNYADFNTNGTDMPGISVFYKNDAGEIFHTYSTYGRGVEVMMGTYNMLDLVPKGRDEAGLSHGMNWVRHHDRYETAPAMQDEAPSGCCSMRAEAKQA